MTGAWTRPCRSRTLMMVRCERWILQAAVLVSICFFFLPFFPFLFPSLNDVGREGLAKTACWALRRLS